MRPLTHSLAKQLLPIANKPILHRAIEEMRRNGITDIGVVVGHTANQVRQSLGNGDRFGVQISYIEQETPLGLAHCVKIARSYLGQDDFVLFLGDNMFQFGLGNLIADFQRGKESRHESARVAVKRVTNPSSFGVAVLDESGFVLSVEEKPSVPKSDLALVGSYCFTPDIHIAIDEISPSARGELEITDAIQHLIESGRNVGVSQTDGWWFDTGNPRAFLECNTSVLIQEIEKQAIPSHSEISILSPCVIDPSAQIENCRIGPNVSIGPEVKISGVNISNSVILSGTTVTGAGSIVDSIIGERCSIRVSGNVVANLVLGDDCEVGISES